MRYTNRRLPYLYLTFLRKTGTTGADVAGTQRAEQWSND